MSIEWFEGSNFRDQYFEMFKTKVRPSVRGSTNRTGLSARTVSSPK